MRRYTEILAVLALSAGMALHAQTNEMVIQTRKLGAEIQPTMYGLFFEDINYAADGGLYAELVKNRSFEFPQHLMGWKTYGKVTLQDDGPFERNPHYVRLSDPGHGHKHTGLDNEGFFGVGVKEGEEYRFSVGHDCHREVRKQHYVLNWSIPNQWASTRLLPHRVLRLIQKNGKNIR